MKIALIADTQESVPPQKYGGSEWIVYYLALGLGKKGHQVDLFASGDSEKNSFYTLFPTIPSGLRLHAQYNTSAKMYEMSNMLSLTKAAELINMNQYDIIHNHASRKFMFFAHFLKKPVITTHHNRIINDYQRVVFSYYKDLLHISVSNNQRRDFPELNFIATILNGVDPEHNAFNDHLDFHAANMLFLGRISPVKGALEAIEVEQKTKQKLLVIAKTDTENLEYFNKFQSLLGATNTEFLGELPHIETIPYLQKSKLLIMPISYEDPCPLTPLEAMSCGTPVVAFAQGALPEQIKDGVTGFLVNYSQSDIRGDWVIKKSGIEGLCEAVERIYAMPPKEYEIMRLACRKHVEENFSVEKMVDGYERVYENILGIKK